MPTDVAVEILTPNVSARAARRLPVGIGLGLGAGASLALWACLAFGVRALFI